MRKKYIRLVLLLFVFIVRPVFANPAELRLPYIDSDSIVVGRDKFDVQLFDTNDKSVLGFVLVVYRDGFLIDIRVLDGLGPKIVKKHEGAWPGNIVGIRFKQGGHETIIQYFILTSGSVREIGEIGSNAACIFKPPGKNNLIATIDVEKGHPILSTYRIRNDKILTIKSAPVARSTLDNVRKNCHERSLE